MSQQPTENGPGQPGKPPPTSYSTDPALYMYTSLTAGSSHIVTATSRLETILRANRIPFKAKDMATDGKARMFWGRRGGKDANGRQRQIPALVQEGIVLGDIVEIEDWNEHRELTKHIKIYYDEHTIPDALHKYPESQLKKRPAKKGKAAKAGEPAREGEASAAAAADATQGNERLRSVADEAAQRAKELRLRSLRRQAGKTEDAEAGEEPRGGEESRETKTGEEKSRETKTGGEEESRETKTGGEEESRETKTGEEDSRETKTEGEGSEGTGRDADEKPEGEDSQATETKTG